MADLGTYTDDVVKASLATLAIRSSVPVEEQLSLLPFKLNELSGLFPVRVLPGAGVVLTDPPKGDAAPSDQPVFVATIGQGGPEQAAERASFARNLRNRPERHQGCARRQRRHAPAWRRDAPTHADSSRSPRSRYRQAA